MATNTVQDLNPKCKASLTNKPCVGKMNGKSEDRPLPRSLVVETEKATVEVEYIESQNLNNVDDADAVLKVTFYDCIKSH